MKRIISIRELALLGVLIILAAYYFVVQGPVAKETDNLTQQRSELENQIIEASIKVTAMNKMQEELDNIYEASGGTPHTLSDYSNNKVLLQELNIILNMADKFDVSFGDMSLEDNVMRREIAISYDTQTKDAAEFIVDSIESSRNTYLITSFDTGVNSNGIWNSSVTLVNYEFVTDKQAEELGLKEKVQTEQDNKSATEQLVDTLTNGNN